MTKQNLALQILVALYRSASRGQFVTISSLSQRMDRDATELDALLGALDRAGYVDREQLRLTLSGLAVAVAAAKKPKAQSLARAA